MRCTVLLIFALLFAPADAARAADITARYASPSGGPLLTIEVDDSGSSRVSMGNQMAVIIRNDVPYIVMADLRGPFAVRQADVVAAMEQALLDRLPPEATRPLPPDDRTFTLVERGRETVAGRTGTLWTLNLRGGSPPPGESGWEWVISADPQLAPVGNVLRRQFTQPGNWLDRSSIFSGMTGGFGEAVRSIMARGTLLRMGRLLRLESVEIGPVDPSRFELPGTVLSRDEFVARIGWPTSRPN